MNIDPAGAGITRRWVRLYTRGLPVDARERRLLEVESDLWEHLNDPDVADREILGRTLRGIHADVWWRYRTLLEHGGARQRSHDIVMGGLGLVTLVVWEHSGLVPADCDYCWQDTAAWATWILSWLAAMVTGGIGIVLGVLRLFTRHQTRLA